MTDRRLTGLRDLVQQDVGGRGLATDPAENLLTVTADDFMGACADIAGTARPSLAVVTGFWIAYATPPGGETDGPLGAVFLARALAPLGIRVTLASDAFCVPALEAGLDAAGLRKEVEVVTLPPPGREGWEDVRRALGQPTHLVALERVGPSHTPQTLGAQPGCSPAHLERFAAEIPQGRWGRCHGMRGGDITDHVSPAHRLFEDPWPGQAPRTVGIGDGGNEIGMGKVPWAVIARNVPRGALTACRTRTDYLVVAGISNWGAYALAAGVRLLRGVTADRELYDLAREEEILRVMVDQGPLVDGMSGRPEASVDGLPFGRYAEPLRRIGEIVAG
jgi:hypothetical protein